MGYTVEAIRAALRAAALAPDETGPRGYPRPGAIGSASGSLYPQPHQIPPQYTYSQCDLHLASILEPTLCQLKQIHGPSSIHLLLSWALGAPLWRTAQRLHCHPRTARNRLKIYLRALSASEQEVDVSKCFQVPAEHSLCFTSPTETTQTATVSRSRSWDGVRWRFR